MDFHWPTFFVMGLLTLMGYWAYNRSFGIKRRFHILAMFAVLSLAGSCVPVEVPANEILHEPN